MFLNMKLLAHHSLNGFGGMGEGMSMQLAKDGRRILWLAHASAPKKFTPVDVSAPRGVLHRPARGEGRGADRPAARADALQLARGRGRPDGGGLPGHEVRPQ